MKKYINTISVINRLENDLADYFIGESIVHVYMDDIIDDIIRDALNGDLTPARAWHYANEVMYCYCSTDEGDIVYHDCRTLQKRVAKQILDDCGYNRYRYSDIFNAAIESDIKQERRSIKMASRRHRSNRLRRR